MKWLNFTASGRSHKTCWSIQPARSLPKMLEAKTGLRNWKIYCQNKFLFFDLWFMVKGATKTRNYKPKTRNHMKPESHPFEAFIPANIQCLIVGSFPGREQTQCEPDER